jgi:hypothetical protein
MNDVVNVGASTILLFMPFTPALRLKKDQKIKSSVKEKNEREKEREILIQLK